MHNTMKPYSIERTFFFPNVWTAFTEDAMVKKALNVDLSFLVLIVLEVVCGVVVA